MKTLVQVYLEETYVGDMVYVQDGRRESCQFKYTNDWLLNAVAFPLSADLPLQSGFIFKSKSKNGSIFFDCMSDTEPNGWGKKVILRDFAMQKKSGTGQQLPSELNSLDFLLWVDDFSRQGALRFNVNGSFRNETPYGRRKAPPVLEFKQLIAAANAIELNQETAKDLDYLRGIGSDLDGMRPKCTVIDLDGTLCLAKFPSVGDTRSYTEAEVLALTLAMESGIDAAQSRLERSGDSMVALIKRFDRIHGRRQMFLSAASMVGDFAGEIDHSYSEIADIIRQKGYQVNRDIEELWRRMVFNILIRNTDDHMHNHGFLHVRKNQWKLSPAFDVNPFPEKRHELKLAITEGSAPGEGIEEAMHALKRFGISESAGKTMLKDILAATGRWRATGQRLGIDKQELDKLEDAFDHEQRSLAEKLVQPLVSVKMK